MANDEQPSGDKLDKSVPTEQALNNDLNWQSALCIMPTAHVNIATPTSQNELLTHCFYTNYFAVDTEVGIQCVSACKDSV